MTKKLFGTDGIRGRANKFPMTPELALNVGRAAVLYFNRDQKPVNIVIGKDTRRSGDMIESALVAGICAAGGNAVSAGIIPTPAVAFLAAESDAGAGVVISASHNPYHDNGIKVFDQNGYKLSDSAEAQLEKIISDPVLTIGVQKYEPGCLQQEKDAGDQYLHFLSRQLGSDFNLRGMKIAIDCSNGATYKVAPKLFARFGAQVIALAVKPNGHNINDQCGSEYPENLSQTVLKEKADIGLAFDGDGDRLIAVDETGQVATGDQILAICAKVLKDKGKLVNNTVVSTVMSNLGFRLALRAHDINFVSTDVGDRYVLAQMLKSGAVIGGEDSGHMIFLAHHTTGDGLLTALKLLEALQCEGRPLSELTRIMTIFPQKLVNVAVKQKPAINTVPEIMAAIQAAEAVLGDQGRVLVRYSGTQPMCRVMVEAPTKAETRHHCQRIADVVKTSIG